MHKYLFVLYDCYYFYWALYYFFLEQIHDGLVPLDSFCFFDVIKSKVAVKDLDFGEI